MTNKDEYKLRKLLAECYCGHYLYKDDGELQSNERTPFIDFRRDSVDEIERKMAVRANIERKKQR